MKVKLGDKLICSKPRIIWFLKDPEPNFTNGKVYEVISIPIGVIPYTGVSKSSLIIRDDKNSIRFLNYNEINPNSTMGKIFMTIKQQRKKKLQRINEKSSLLEN